MRVLVTGAAGYVGRAVVYRLAEAGYQVTAVTRSPRSVPVRFPPGTEVVAADVRDPARLAALVAHGEYGGVCHLAALTRVRESLAHPLRYFTVNVQGTVNLLDAMAQAAARTGRAGRLVFASSGAVYGPSAAQPISEDLRPNPANPYGSSKLAAEQVIAHQAATGAVGAVSLRCFNAAGATPEVGDTDASRLIPKALAVACGLAPHLEVNGDGSTVRELTHVADLADAYALALEAAEPGTHQVYNVGSSVGVTLNDIITAIEEAAGAPLPVRSRPAQNEPRVLVADSSRVRAELRWEPTRSTLGRIIGDAWRWQRAQLP